MRFRLEHVTRYTYTGPISETHMEVRLRPSEELGQRVVEFELEVDPPAGVREYVDGFGNHVHHFDQLPPHEFVQVTSRALVDTVDGDAREDDGDDADRHGTGHGRRRRQGGRHRPSADDGGMQADFLLFRSPVVEAAGIHTLAHRHRPRDPSSRAAVEEALDGLAVAISRDFEYRPLTTTVTTAVDEVLRLRSGVCQDFAHLFIAVARAMGVPARYVSGYVYSGTGAPVVGASHAWAEAWLPRRGWIGYDATHPIRAGERHIRLAVGRDYRDAAPTRGVYVGAARGQLEVRVEITPD